MKFLIKFLIMSHILVKDQKGNTGIFKVKNQPKKIKWRGSKPFFFEPK